MAAVRVPLDEPFLVKISDHRPLRLAGVRNEGAQSVVVNDARSNHLTLRVMDPNAQLSEVMAWTPARTDLAAGTFEARSTSEVHSVYAFEPDRDYRIALTFRVTALGRLQAVPYTLSLLLFLLSLGMVVFEPSRRDLGYLAGPATFAASILLIREPSALGSHLGRVSTVVVASTTTALLAVAAYEFVRQSLGA